MAKVYLLLGSNIGDAKNNLSEAGKLIHKEIGKIKRFSAIYRTAAWGKLDQPDFLNQVVIVETRLSPEMCMKTILDIEKKMGRIRTVKNAPRIIDIDILFFDKIIQNSKELTIPHPLLQERNFVLVPLNELSPKMKHPVINRTIHQLLLNCSDRLAVKKN